MKKLILVIAFLGLVTIPSIAQNNTTLGGISCSLNVPSTVTVYEGAILNITANTSYNCWFSWQTSNSKYTLFQTPKMVSGTNSSTAKVQFIKAGTYNISVTVWGASGVGSNQVTVTVIPKIKLSGLTD